ncbi:MAG: transglycosylase SLT domain-containing protein [Terriglobales bacterium]
MLKRILSLGLLASLSSVTFPVPAAAQSASLQTKAPVIAPPIAAKQWTGDLDVLLQHRVIRVAVPYSKTFYYEVDGVQYGVAYEAGKAFEEFLNKKYPQKNKNIKIHILFLVTPREKMYAQLTGGNVDIVTGGLSITPERQKLVDFSDPTADGINEVVVAGPKSPQLASLDDLAGKEIFVRKLSSYWEHLERLNERFQKENRPAVILRAVPEDLGDEDLLQMVNAGLLPTTIVNDWTAKLWGKLLTKMQIHTDIAINTGGTLGWIVRKDSPKLLATADEFLKTHRQGTAFGQQLMAKYMSSTYMLKQAVSVSGMKRFEETAEIFRKYSSQYGMDYLLMMAEGFQESGLKQDAKSSVGAVGVMQLMPDTGKQMNVGDIHQQEANIHAGIKYFHSMVEKNYGNEPMDDLNRVLFTFAAYNCGPGRMRQLRKEAAAKGLDPNVWIDNVEVIAAARIGRISGAQDDELKCRIVP